MRGGGNPRGQRWSGGRGHGARAPFFEVGRADGNPAIGRGRHALPEVRGERNEALRGCARRSGGGGGSKRSDCRGDLRSGVREPG